MEERYTDRRRFSFGAPPWCDVRAETSNAKPAAACEASAGEPPLAVSEEEAQLSSLLLRVRRAALAVLGQISIQGRRRRKARLISRAAVVRRSS